MLRLPFRTTVILALSLGLVLVALSTVAAYATIHSLLDDTRQETQSQDAIITLKDVVSQFKAAESLQRRYLLTGRNDDLADYQQARLETGQTLQDLRGTRLSDGNSPAGGDFQTLQALVTERLALLEQVVATRQASGLGAAIARLDSEHNRQLHVAIESVTARIETVEQAERTRSAASTAQTARLVRQLILAVGLLSLALLLWALWMIVRAQARRELVETKLSESEALSSAVAEGMAEGVITTTDEGIIVAANSAARQLFAYRPEALQGQDISMLLPERYRADFNAFFATMLARESGFRESGTAVSCLRSDGTEFPAKVSFGDVRVKGRRLCTAIIRDLTESRRIGQALRDSEAQLRQITDTVPALIACLDKHQRFEFHNKAYEEVFGLPADQIHQKTLLSVLGRSLYAEVHSHVREALMGYAVRYEREHVTASGEQRAYVMNYFPRYAEVDGRDEVIGLFALGMDVTELKRIDRMKSEFVSTVSHELRTPLTSIRGSLGLVWGGVTGVLPDKAHNLVGIAKNNCERLIRLINDILDSEKIESGKMSFDLQPLDLGLLLEQTLAANEGFAAERQVTLALRAPRFPVHVQADSDRLTQVVTNLLSNAIKFSPAGAEVVVAVQTDPDPYARRVRVEIIDKGPGIPVEFQRRIFQKFSQADSSDTRQKGGTGLGLNISKAIIERMEGSIGFQTEINVGTTFFFDLPEWREAPPVTAPASLDTALRPRVLVCEDDADLAHLVGLILDDGGFDVDTAHSPAQARTLLDSTRYCAMTVDLRLKQLSGLDLVRELRLNPATRQLPVLVLSSMASEVRNEGGHQALGIAAWLEKPLDAERLLACLRQAIKQSRVA